MHDRFDPHFLFAEDRRIKIVDIDIVVFVLVKRKPVDMDIFDQETEFPVKPVCSFIRFHEIIYFFPDFRRFVMVAEAGMGHHDHVLAENVIGISRNDAGKDLQAMVPFLVQDIRVIDKIDLEIGAVEEVLDLGSPDFRGIENPFLIKRR